MLPGILLEAQKQPHKLTHMATTQASIFYDNLPDDSKEAFTKIASLVDEATPEREGEWLDYKNGKDIPLDSKEGKNKIRELWGKALSGFANSGGGLVVWGIQTRNDGNHDVPANLALVPNPVALMGLLKTYLATEVEPPVLDVRFRSLANDQAEGFVIADIPPSRLRPHEAKFLGKYFLRSSHQHVPANPATLRILFYPNSSPVLDLKCDLDGISMGLGCNYRLRLINKGFASASDMLIFIKSDQSDINFQLESKDFIDEGTAGALHRMRCQHDLHPSLGMRVGKGFMPRGAFYRVLIYGSHFEPSQWSIEMEINGDAPIVSGPFDVQDNPTPRKRD